VGNEAARVAAEVIGGFPSSAINEVLLDTPTTAHIIGGACIGANASEGAIDAYHRVFGYEGLHVADGSAVTGNLGVNPALTITAMTERAISFWPNCGDTDPRPPLGEPYLRATPQPPRQPAVATNALGALRSY
jgi:cholesterol oxidase